METLTAVLPFALAGSILPTWTLVVIALLGTARPVANAMAFGAALIALAAWVWRSSRDPDAGSWVERAEHIRPRTSFLAGLIAVASPGVQYAYLLGGIAAILESGRGLSSAAALLGFVLGLAGAYVVVLGWMQLVS